MVAMALLGMLTYSGSGLGAAVGYLLAVLAASVFAPAAGALTNELFPTSVRASVIGWEIAVGVFGATAGVARLRRGGRCRQPLRPRRNRGVRGHDSRHRPFRAVARDA